MTAQVGDYLYRRVSAIEEVPSLMEAQIRTLKLNLEGWREIALNARRVLIWEKNWHPTALFAGSTITFTLLWLLDPSVLTVISLLGLLITAADYLVPILANSLFKPELWTSNKEKEFEQICMDVVLYKTKLELTWDSYYRLKTTSRKMYFTLTMVVLSAVAWLGCTFNNLFLSYALVTFALLLPGMEHNGIMNKWRFYVQSFLNGVVKQARSKVAQEKTD